MSQLPNPYQPQPSRAFASNPLTPARRASTTMFILGALMLLCGLGMSAMAWLPIEKIAAEKHQELPQLPPGLTWDLMRQTAKVITYIFVPLGLAQIATAVFVRRGGAAASMVGIVLAVLMVLYLVINAASAILVQHSTGSALFCQTCQHAQQAGLATAIGTPQYQGFATFNRKFKLRKQRATAARKRQIFSSQF